MIQAKKGMGFFIYLFMALPVMLGGMGLLSVRSWATDPGKYKALITDQRFTAVLESPELARLAPGTVTIRSMSLEGPAMVKALQAGVPASAVVDTATAGVDAVFKAIAEAQPTFALDITKIKAALDKGADDAAAVYMVEAKDPFALLPPGSALPGPAATDSVARGSQASQGVLAAAVRDTARSLPDYLVPTENPLALPGEVAGKAVIGPSRVADLSRGLSQAAIWLSLAGLGLWIASSFVSETELRKRLGVMGKRIILPGSLFLGVGLLPHLINPALLARGQAAGVLSDFPALSEYARFVSTSLTGGALVVGLVAVGLGTLLVSAKRAIPPKEDFEDGADL